MRLARGRRFEVADMAMVCAQCGASFGAEMRLCPTCNLQLLVQHRETAHDDGLSVDARAGLFSTPWGRVVVGLMISQGAAFVLQRIGMAAFLAAGWDATAWMSPFGLMLLHTFHFAALVAAGMLVAANQPRGVACAVALGLWNGIVFLGVHRGALDLLGSTVFFAQPFLHVVFGAIGGVLGNRIWQPAPLFSVEPTEAEKEAEAKKKKAASRAKLWLYGPVHPARIAVGAVLAAAAVIFARVILEQIVAFSGGAFRIGSHAHETLFRYQIAALGAFLGAAFGGACTLNGFKQGLFIGPIAATVYLGSQFADPNAQFETALLTVLGVLVLSVAGGAFGSHLFPPLVPQRAKDVVPY